jgi:excisionase family DNA binding protein
MPGVNLREAADRLGIQPDTLRQQIRAHRLRARKMGRDWFVSEEEFARYQREQHGKPGPKRRKDAEPNQ